MFLTGIRIHSWFNSKSSAAIQGRKEQLAIPEKRGKRVLVHCASLGEFEQVKPVIDGLIAEGIEVVLTFFSPSGYEQVRDYAGVVWIGYLPFDRTPAMRVFWDEVAADGVVFVKYEFWWNCISAIIERGIPLYFVSVIMREDHYIFRAWARPFISLLQRASKIYVVDEATETRLVKQGYRNVERSADTRAESVLNRKLEGYSDTTIERFAGGDPVVIFGSTYSMEHAEIARISDDLLASYKLIIFPHNIDGKELMRLKERIGKHCMLYSELEKHGFLTDYRVLIVDRIGLLKDAYAHATLAYIGGGLTGGLHNTLEPFVYKIPLVFGYAYEKFPEARLFAKQRFTIVINEVGALKEAILELGSCEVQDDIEEIYSRIFGHGKSASGLIVDDIKRELWKGRG